MSVDVKLKTLIIYETATGKEPFNDWFNGLKDRRVRAAVDARLTRIRNGNLGLCRSLGDGVWEFKFDLGPGFRIYFGQHGDSVVVLLHGGDKGTQTKDIERAKEYWRDYLKDQEIKK
jgi:putative addiction module killer protein